jgi:hypothetical protein
MPIRNPKALLIGAGVGLAVLSLIVLLSLSAYAGSDLARNALLTGYFRALASGDQAAIEEFTGPEFESDLGLAKLERGSYELYDFGEEAEGTARFMLVSTAADGEKRAVLGDMIYRRHGISIRIDALRRVDEGRRLKE